MAFDVVECCAQVDGRLGQASCTAAFAVVASGFVKGKDTPAVVYEVCDFSYVAEAASAEAVGYYDEALGIFFAEDVGG